ncbi:AMP-binding protein [Maricurvus nonylphenolicus]|uniref:AMP-dependent synthetase/ligase n=1 Tax=Maricurvus nonylphenolicus TaxID=1008307 RepID=UPI0036F2B4B2
MTAIKTPLQMLEHWAATFPDQVYLRQSTGSDWIDYSWSQVADRVKRLATYIVKKEYPAGSRIAIWSSNSADWFIADLAIMLSGNISVPVYPAQDLETAGYILKHAEPKMLFAGQFEQAANLREVLPEQTDTVAIRGATSECDVSLEVIIAETASQRAFPQPALDDVCTIIYSSGTSGNPKGVMHSYRSVSETAPLLAATYGRPKYEAEGDERESAISYLPLSHAAERSLLEITSLYLNSRVSISAGLEFFAKEIHDTQPTFFGAVPRIWHKFKEGVEAALAAQGKSIETDADRLMVREMLGLGQTKTCITGSAPVAAALHQWYAAIGLQLRESYSSTETFAHGTYWNSDDPAIPGCVGKPCLGVEVKLDENNEILFKSPSLMKGYYKEPEKTAEVIKDGWYASGDLGRMDENGNLWITGRVGSIFKTSKGKFINPEKLEREIYKLPSVDQACVFGHGMAQPVAVVNVAESAAGKTDDEIKAYFTEELGKLNDALPAHERMSALLVERKAWTVDGGVLTPTLKIKRKALEGAYRAKLGDSVSGVIVEEG